MKKIIVLSVFCLSLSLSFSTHAQTCQNKLINPQVTINITPLQVDLSKSVHFLKQENRNDKHYPIGMYVAPKNVVITPQYTIITNTWNGQVCAEIKNVEVQLNVAPTIYISQEAQRYNCTYRRVYNHEMTHYQIELNALNHLKNYLNNIISSNYSVAISGTNEMINQKINIKNKSTINTIIEIIEKNTLPYHNQLDTNENYMEEAKQCSELENVELSKVLLGRYDLNILK